MESKSFEPVKIEPEERESNAPRRYKECYTVEVSSACTKDLKDLIKEILLGYLSRPD